MKARTLISWIAVLAGVLAFSGRVEAAAVAIRLGLTERH